MPIKYGTKEEVWEGIAQLTKGNIPKSGLTKNENGKVVFKAKRQAAQRNQHARKKFGATEPKLHYVVPMPGKNQYQHSQSAYNYSADPAKFKRRNFLEYLAKTHGARNPYSPRQNLGIRVHDNSNASYVDGIDKKYHAAKMKLFSKLYPVLAHKEVQTGTDDEVPSLNLTPLPPSMSQQMYQKRFAEEEAKSLDLQLRTRRIYEQLEKLAQLRPRSDDDEQIYATNDPSRTSRRRNIEYLDDDDDLPYNPNAERDRVASMAENHAALMSDLMGRMPAGVPVSLIDETVTNTAPAGVPLIPASVTPVLPPPKTPEIQSTPQAPNLPAAVSDNLGVPRSSPADLLESFRQRQKIVERVRDAPPSTRKATLNAAGYKPSPLSLKSATGLRSATKVRFKTDNDDDEEEGTPRRGSYVPSVRATPARAVPTSSLPRDEDETIALPTSMPSLPGTPGESFATPIGVSPAAAASGTAKRAAPTSERHASDDVSTEKRQSTSLLSRLGRAFRPSPPKTPKSPKTRSEIRKSGMSVPELYSPQERRRIEVKPAWVEEAV